MPFTDVPPSYDSSISREAWSIVAPYIPSPDLCACCLVSHKWHGIFVPFLWGDPASHFGLANDAVYIALTRFKKTLRRVRPSVRGLTHTLHLPPALSEIYGGPHATWLRDVLEYLPNLQSLIVNKLPFFDHHSLVALRTTSTARRLSSEERPELPTFGLKLLLAAGEPNTTSQGLHIAIPRFPALVYLDLSYTKTARDPNVLANFANLHDLQVLKLQGIGLRDGEAEVLANAIGIRVRLLDLRDNLLTDMAVRSLIQACFLASDRNPDASRLNTRRVEDWPIGMAPGPDFFSLDTLRGEELDHELLKQLTNPLTGRLAFEDIPHRGLTHLFIANNQLSVEGLSSLLKSERLHILDGGSVDVVKTIARTKSLTSSTGYVDEVKFPGAEKLIPVLAKSASKNLTYLRVDHAVITAKFDAPKEKDILKDNVPTPKSVSAANELPGTAPLAAELPSESRTVVELSAPARYAVEMPTSRDAIFEMDATPMQPRAELPGDIIHFAVSPPVGDKPEAETPTVDVKSPIRGEGPYAPEVVVNGNGNGHINGDSDTEDDHHTHDNNKVSDESSTNSTTKSLKSPVSPITPAVQNAFQPLVVPVTAAPKLPKPQSQHAPSPPPPISAPPPPPPQRAPPPLPPRSQPLRSQPSPTARQLRIDFLLSKRPISLSSQSTSTKPAPASLTELHPSVLPNLRTLILTSVPTTVPLSSPLIPALKSFISSCAIESALSHLLAATDYSLPPGRARHFAEQAAAKRLFALRTIVLEMESPSALSKSGGGSGQRAWEHSRQRVSMSKSSTGDRDSENLWTAAADDFSFFAEGGGEEEDECGIYQHEQDKYFLTANLDEKMLVGADESSALFDLPNGGAGGNSPHGSFKSLSPIHALGRSGTSYNTAPLRSPRELPLGRNRRSSNEAQRNSFDGAPGTPRSERNVIMEMAGSGGLPLLSAPRIMAQISPTSNPNDNANAGAGRPRSPSGKSDPGSPDEPTVDVVAELASWRKQRKTAFETAMNHFARFKPDVNQGNREGDAEGLGEILPPFVEGYWNGEVKVVRNAAPKGRSGIVDVFGNYFEKGYLYP